MFMGYLNDMKSWIFFFIGMLGLVDLILWLDEGIIVELTSVVYFNVLIIILFKLFIFWRYQKEMKFSKEISKLADQSSLDWHEALPETIFMRDEIMLEILHQVEVSLSKEIAELKRASITESDYTAAWVHEVKAPLTAIKLTIDGHRNDPVIRKIEAEWLRVHLLIEQQLYISRLQSLEEDYVLEKTNVYGLVSAEVRELASWCLEKKLAVEIEGGDEEVVTDVKWCRFVIRQLLSNAVKYSPEGGTIFISKSVMPSGNIVLVIKDEGPGIKAHDLPRIFDKGFTGSTGRLHNAATGLGLYLAQMVATKVGITITARSELGQGTIMHVMFSTENDFDKIVT